VMLEGDGLGRRVFGHDDLKRERVRRLKTGGE
jgi:hypothetical protein